MSVDLYHDLKCTCTCWPTNDLLLKNGPLYLPECWREGKHLDLYSLASWTDRKLPLEQGNRFSHHLKLNDKIKRWFSYGFLLFYHSQQATSVIRIWCDYAYLWCLFPTGYFWPCHRGQMWPPGPPGTTVRWQGHIWPWWKVHFKTQGQIYPLPNISW
jgi:hypothetical protein